MPVERYKFDSVVKPGMPIVLDVSWPESLEGEYKSTVYDYSLKDKKMRIAMPSYKGRLVPLPKGARIYVKVVDRGSLYVFQSTALWSGRAKEDGLPSTIIAIPDYVRKVQRRRYNRIPINLKGTYTREEDPVPRTFTTIDFSAGGMLILVGEELKVDEIIYVTLKLKPGLELKDHPTKVVREAGKKEIYQWLYGVEFLEVGMELEKKLVRFVMEKELEYKKKGIIL